MLINLLLTVANYIIIIKSEEISKKNNRICYDYNDKCSIYEKL